MSTDLTSAVQSLDSTSTLQLLSGATIDTDHLEDLVAAYLSSCLSSPTRTSEYTSFPLDLEANGKLPKITIIYGDGAAYEETFAAMMRREVFEIFSMPILVITNSTQQMHISLLRLYLVHPLDPDCVRVQTSPHTSRKDCNWIQTRTKRQIRERFRPEPFMRSSPY